MSYPPRRKPTAKPAPIAKPIPADVVVAYVDGSANASSVAFGVALVRGEELLHEISGPVPPHPDLNNMRQVGGEIWAVREAVRWAQEQGIAVLHIVYDYEGLEKWATGAWKTNKPATQQYAAFMRGLPLRVIWHKVVSHTGVKWNERADQLARKWLK